MATIYVKSTAGGADDGTSWADAFLTMEQATTSWVADGNPSNPNGLILFDINHNEAPGGNIIIDGPAGQDDMINRLTIIRVDSATGAYAPAWVGGVGGSGGGPVNFFNNGGAQIFRINAHIAVYGMRVRCGSDFDVTTQYTQKWEGCEIEFGIGGSAGRDIDLDAALKVEFVNTRLSAALSSDCNIRVNGDEIVELIFRHCNLSGLPVPVDGMVLGTDDSLVKARFESCRLTDQGAAIIDVASMGGGDGVGITGAQSFVFDRCAITTRGRFWSTLQTNRGLHIDSSNCTVLSASHNAPSTKTRFQGHSEEPSGPDGMGVAGRVETYSGSFPTAALFTEFTGTTPVNRVSAHEPIVTPLIVGFIDTLGLTTFTVQIYSPVALTDETTWMRLSYRDDATSPCGKVVETTRTLPGVVGAALTPGVGIAAWDEVAGFSYALSITVTVAAAGTYQSQVLHTLTTTHANAVFINPKVEVS